MVAMLRSGKVRTMVADAAARQREAVAQGALSIIGVTHYPHSSSEGAVALDMPVTGASRYEQRQSSSPNPTTVLTSDDFRVFGWRNLGDALRALRGIYITNDRNYDYVGVRGFGIPGDYNTRLLVLIDGHRLNDAVYDSTDPGFGFPLDLVDVESRGVVHAAGPIAHRHDPASLARQKLRGDRSHVAEALDGHCGPLHVHAEVRERLADDEHAAASGGLAPAQ